MRELKIILGVMVAVLCVRLIAIASDTKQPPRIEWHFTENIAKQNLIGKKIVGIWASGPELNIQCEDGTEFVYRPEASVKIDVLPGGYTLVGGKVVTP